jgi:hypothetical protein
VPPLTIVSACSFQPGSKYGRTERPLKSVHVCDSNGSHTGRGWHGISDGVGHPRVHTLDSASRDVVSSAVTRAIVAAAEALAAAATAVCLHTHSQPRQPLNEDHRDRGDSAVVSDTHTHT